MKQNQTRLNLLVACLPPDSQLRVNTVKVPNTNVKAAAADLLSDIRRNISDLSCLLFRFCEEECWVSLGYDSFKECIESEFGEEEYPNMRRTAIKSQIAYSVAGEDGVRMDYSFHALEPLNRLKVKQRKAVWRKLQEHIGGPVIPKRKLTRELVETIIAGLYPELSKEKNMNTQNVNPQAIQFAQKIKTLDVTSPDFLTQVLQAVLACTDHKTRLYWKLELKKNPLKFTGGVK